MHATLAQALNLLDINDVRIVNDGNEVIRKFTGLEHAEALFTYLDLAGYLSPALLEKAINYLSTEKPLACPNEIAIGHLKEVYATAHAGGRFNIAWFLENFCNAPYFGVDDVIDLIVFLQQTAFDRQFGVERDKLQAQPWLVEHMDLFQRLTTTLGVTTPLPPAHDTYCGTGIMGAASVRVETRIQYFNSLKANCGELWALSGKREMSRGLDKEDIMIKVAEAAGKPINFVKKGAGAAEREYIDGVTETMMVNYFLQIMCADKKIALIDSAVEEGHWRATTAQGATDIARTLIQKILKGGIAMDEAGIYRFMIIAEQPYAGRMARQVQRAFNAEIHAHGLEKMIKSFVVEGVGSGIPREDLSNIEVLKRVNSELGSLMAERFYDARLRLSQGDLKVPLRDPKILMFMDRDAKFLTLQEMNAASAASPSP